MHCFFVGQIVLLLSCILAFFLNYSVFLNTTLNSALTQTICGNLKVCIFLHDFFFTSSVLTIPSCAICIFTGYIFCTSRSNLSLYVCESLYYFLLWEHWWREGLQLESENTKPCFAFHQEPPSEQLLRQFKAIIWSACCCTTRIIWLQIYIRSPPLHYWRGVCQILEILTIWTVNFQ